MNIEQFKEVADLNLSDLTVDERLVARIRQSTCQVSIKPKRSKSIVAIGAAAACMVVMLVSGVMFANNAGFFAANANAPGTPAPLGVQAQSRAVVDVGTHGNASVLSAQTLTSLYKDGTTLGYGIEEIGTYAQGYAVALATNGLYGYVDESGTWVIRALYDSAEPVTDGLAQVVAQGVVQIISIEE